MGAAVDEAEPSPAWNFDRQEVVYRPAMIDVLKRQRRRAAERKRERQVRETETLPSEILPKRKAVPDPGPDVSRAESGPRCWNCGRTGCPGHPKREE